jgi:uncharacterized damage-inducible protein DinB
MDPLFADYFNRLQNLHQQFIATFEDLPAEALDWVPGEDMNSFCVMVVHTTGSARYWIGEMALGDPANRDRDAEFRARGLSVAELKACFTQLEDYARAGLDNVSLDDLALTREASYQDAPVSGRWALMHALAHTGMHLGHAQITRQLWERR